MEAVKVDMKEKMKDLQSKIKNASLEDILDFSKSWVKGKINGTHPYSMYNYMSANFQMKMRGKRCSSIAPYKFWESKGRRVRAGEKALYVFAPIIVSESHKKDDGSVEEKREVKGYRLVPVFDFSQTDGDLSKIDITKGGLVGDWVIGKSKVSFENLISISHIPVEMFEISPTGSDGWTNGKTINVLNHESENAKIATFIHELAHSIMHFKPTAEKLTSHIKEVEAESVAFIVGSILGLEVKSAPLYVKGWGDFSDEVRVKEILSASEKILASLIEKNLIELESVAI